MKLASGQANQTPPVAARWQGGLRGGFRPPVPLPQALGRCVRPAAAQQHAVCSTVTTQRNSDGWPQPGRPHPASPPPPAPAWASEDRSLGFRVGESCQLGALCRGRLLLHWVRGGRTCGASRRPVALLSMLLCSLPCSRPGRPSGGTQRGACGCRAQDWGASQVVAAWCRRGEACTAGSPPHSRFRSPAGCLQKWSLELCVSDHSVGVQGPDSSLIVRYVCTFQPSNLINDLCKNREVQFFKESLLVLFRFNLAFDEMVTSRLVSEGTGQRLDSAREPEV